jgi:RNA polymerase sigma factor (sigma-70 family)
MYITDEQLVEDGERFFRSINRRYRVSYDEQDDLQQHIYIALLVARKKFDPSKGSWDAYSASYAYNAVREFFRYAPLAGRHWDRATGQVTYISDIAEHPIGVYEIQPALLQELRPYTSKEQKIILYLLAGYSSVETAYYCGISPSTISRILVRLRIKNSPFSSSLLMDLQWLRQAA